MSCGNWRLENLKLKDSLAETSTDISATIGDEGETILISLWDDDDDEVSDLDIIWI